MVFPAKPAFFGGQAGGSRLGFGHGAGWMTEPGTDANPAPLRLSLNGITRRQGAEPVLENVSLAVRPGEIHALIGESGSGKAVLARIIAGLDQPDSGTLQLDGRKYEPRSADAARRAGVAFLAGQSSMAADLAVEENILLGREPNKLGFLSPVASAETAAAVMDELGRRGISRRATVRQLSAADRRVVEIGRALASGRRLLVLEEPANSLGKADTRRVFAALGRLARNGTSVIYVCRHPGEAGEIADSFTVLRDGRVSGAGLMAEHGPAELAAMSLGGEPVSPCRRTFGKAGEIVMSVDDLAGGDRVKSADLVLRRGEVLGIAGLTGAGRTELLRLIFAMDSTRRGEVRIGTGAGGASPAARIRQGVGMLGEDRRHEGMAEGMSVADNITLSDMDSLGSFGFLNRRRQAAAAAVLLKRLNVNCPDPRRPASVLSRSDRRKVALARLIHQDADILLLDDPTAGMSVAARKDACGLIAELASGTPANGVSPRAVIMVSDSLHELLGMCDRIAVMTGGVLYPARPVAEWTEERLRMAVMGEVAA
jgi:ribose transport system ATP-binding protein